MVQNGVVNRSRRLATESPLTGRHLIQHQAEGKEIGAGIKFLAVDLLRRHVTRCPDRQACSREMRHNAAIVRRGDEDAVLWLGRIGGLWRSLLWLTCLQQLCQTKVQNFAYALVGKKNVGWL